MRIARLYRPSSCSVCSFKGGQKSNHYRKYNLKQLSQYTCDRCPVWKIDERSVTFRNNNNARSWTEVTVRITEVLASRIFFDGTVRIREKAEADWKEVSWFPEWKTRNVVNVFYRKREVSTKEKEGKRESLKLLQSQNQCLKIPAGPRLLIGR